MKKIYLLLAFLCAALSTRAQNIMFNYQAVARDLNNQPYKTTPAEAMTVGISIVDDNKKELYSEDFENVATSQLGIFNLLIGTGKNKAGKLEDIDWTASKPLFLAATIKLGNSFEKSLPPSQLVYVPFSIFAVTADNLKDPVGGDLSGPYRNAQLKPEVVGTPELANEAVTNGKIAGEAVDNVKLADEAVTSGKIKDREVMTEDLADGAVTTNKIKNDAIDNDKIANGSLDYKKLAGGTASNGQVLKWNAGAWVPQNDNDTPVTAGSGISVSGNVISAVDSSASNEIQSLTWNGSSAGLGISGGAGVTLSAGGDVSGNLNALKLASLIDVGASGLTLSGGMLTLSGSKTMNSAIYNYFTFKSGSYFEKGDCTSSCQDIVFSKGTFPLIGTVGGNNQYSIDAKNNIRAIEFDAVSDLRIKHIIGTSHRQQDRVALEKIAVRDFYYKDMVAHGTQSKKGFIAQEVEKIFPEAVSHTTDFIPDIYQVARQVQYDPARRSLRLTVDSLTGGLQAGDRLRIIADQQREATVSAVQGNTITVQDWPVADTQEAFVYGKQVNDFCVVDYDRIFTLNVSVTQALIQEVDDLKAQVAALQAQNTQLARQNASIQSLEARLNALAARIEAGAGIGPTEAENGKEKK